MLVYSINISISIKIEIAEHRMILLWEIAQWIGREYKNKTSQIYIMSCGILINIYMDLVKF